MGCRFGSRCGRSSPPHSVVWIRQMPALRLRVTVAFWTSLPLASLSAANALISGFCSSGYDFAILSSCLHLTMQTLGVAMGFVGNYAPCRLSPQTDGMPVIPKKTVPIRTPSFLHSHLQPILDLFFCFCCNPLNPLQRTALIARP